MESERTVGESPQIVDAEAGNVTAREGALGLLATAITAVIPLLLTPSGDLLKTEIDEARQVLDFYDPRLAVFRQKQLQVVDLMLNPVSREVMVRGVKHSLSRPQVAIMNLLMSNAGHTVSLATLSEAMKGTTKWITVDAVRKQIEKLRKIVEKDPKSPQLILTIKGEGYLLYAVKEKQEG